MNQQILLWVLSLALVLVACKPVPEGCGDGEILGIEQCDNGELNSDTEKDACRLDCRTAYCGDTVVDSGESCDDGNEFGGDGCNPVCSAESGVLEEEPNDDFMDAKVLNSGDVVTGGLPELDVDCFAITVPNAALIRAEILGSGETMVCSEESALFFYNTAGVYQTVGWPNPETGCALLDPAVDARVGYLEAGTYYVCVEGLQNTAVSTYQLSISVGEGCGPDAPAPNADQDLDGDGEADACETDIDGDGVANESDNCPRVPNGPNQPFLLDSSDAGFNNFWLFLGPITGQTTPGGCEPTANDDADPAGLDDGDAAPDLGDMVLGRSWQAYMSWPQDSARIDFTTVFNAVAPRQSYAFAWVYSPQNRSARLLVGADDGLRVWLNGAQLNPTITSCQGVTTDQFRWDINLNQGWNRLLMKVWDGGGGWGLHVHFVDSNGEDMTDLEFSLWGAGSWNDNQGDMDGDGLGDVCDPAPAVP